MHSVFVTIPPSSEMDEEVTMPYNIPGFLLFTAPPSESTLRGIGKSIQVLASRSQTDQFYAMPYHFPALHTLELGTLKRPNQAIRPAEEETESQSTQKTSRRQYSSARSSLEQQEKGIEFHHQERHAQQELDLSTFIVSCQSACPMLLAHAEQQLSYFAKMIGAPPVPMQAVQARVRNFIALSNDRQMYKRTPTWVYTEMAAIAVAATEAAATVMNPQDIAFPAVGGLRTKVQAFATQQPLLDASALHPFVQSVNQALNEATGTMISAYRDYRKMNPAPRSDPGQSRDSRYSLRSSASSDQKYPEHPYAFKQDGSPLPYGTCFYVQNGKCTNPKCTFSEQQHDFTSHGVKWPYNQKKK